MRTVCAGDGEQEKGNARKERVRALEDRDQTVRARRTREGGGRTGGVVEGGERERKRVGGRDLRAPPSQQPTQKLAPVRYTVERERERENERERE